MADGQPKHVKAIFNFKGTNNDELCFSKGDIVTVTQVVDGGWWEGTLNGKTGWFPSNYVKQADINLKSTSKGAEVPVYKRESMQLYHNVVLKNVIETERMHVAEMTKVLQSYFRPIQAKGILSPAEYSILIGNLEEIINFQQSFLAAIEECEKEELRQCVESLGCPVPGANHLTTYLSKPFTRLDRYPSLLKELERHIENSCMEIRKLKEMEYEILTSNIRGWEGEEIRQLGEVLHLSQVKLHTQTGEKYERIFVLFSSALVMLSMSPRLSSYQYEGKLPLSGMTVNKCEDTEKYPNGFEISGPMIEKLVVTCGTKMEVAAWLEVLGNTTKHPVNPVSVKPQSLQPSISTITPAKTAQISHTVALPMPPRPTSVWSLTCLRPAPPLRPTLMCRDDALRSPRSNRKSTQRRKPVTYNEDAFILQVIEAYCNSAKTRHTVNSSLLNNPNVIIADEEKILVFDDTEKHEEKTLVDTVYSLKDKVRQLEQEQKRMRQDLDEERRARVRLEAVLRNTTAASSSKFPASAAAAAATCAAVDVNARDNTPPT
nr:hypothetical protein BaRGS_014368 [Batillaria attramentaria]